MYYKEMNSTRFKASGHILYIVIYAFIVPLVSFIEKTKD